jgi:hypothetical protein
MRTTLTIALGLALGCGGDGTSTSPDANRPSDAAPVPDAACSAANSTTYYVDTDSDGYGDPEFIAVDCVKPDGFVENNLDCNDSDPRDNPDGTELCDGIDNDCDVATEEICPNLCSPQLNGKAAYLFCGQGLNYTAASLACEGQDMHLVRVNDLLEQQWISDQRVIAFGSKVTAWHGGSDSVTENTWLWRDGTEFWQGRSNGVAVDGLFAIWRGGEPNNDNGEDCGVFNDNSTGSWDDRECNNNTRFICERNAPPE